MAAEGKEFDIIIIGAGILGVSCAYHLKKNRPDKEILLVDRFPAVGQGNTARSNAMFRNTFTSRDNRTLADSSISFYLDVEKSGVDLGIRKTGYLWMMSEKQLSSNERHVRKMIDEGIELRRYDRRELERELPSMRTRFDSEEAKMMKLDEVTAAVFGPKCGRLDPDKLTRFYADDFVSMGGKIALNTNCKSLIVEPEEPLGIEGEPFVWQDGHVAGAHLEGMIVGDVKAGTVVIAAGVWNNELLEPIGIDGHVKAKKRQLFAVSYRANPGLAKLARDGNFNDVGVIPFVILPKSGCFLKAVVENGEFWVGCEDDLNRPFINVPERDLVSCKAETTYYERSVYPILKEYFPEFENTRPEHMWAGLYSYNTLDNIPFVFEEGGMIIAGGGSGSGVMKADAMGRIVDATYRFGQSGSASLYGGLEYPVNKLGFKSRAAQREEWVI